jgi:8-hydroxy-5-deazaflavin:NADPH oxidoreductase
MKIGILGTGDVGQALGNAFVALGHEVLMGARDPASAKARNWSTQAGTRAAAGGFGDAARFGEIAVLAVLGVAAEEAVDQAGPDQLEGKVVIDATNPLRFREGAPPELAWGFSDSGGERVQRRAPNARVVKAFNTVGHAHMFRPQFPAGPPDMFICGNDAEAKATVTRLLTAFGWDTVDIGGIEGSRHLEPMCMVWVLYGLASGSWNHAFKLLR